MVVPLVRWPCWRGRARARRGHRGHARGVRGPGPARRDPAQRMMGTWPAAPGCATTTGRMHACALAGCRLICETCYVDHTTPAGPADHRLPRRRQPDRARGRAGAAPAAARPRAWSAGRRLRRADRRRRRRRPQVLVTDIRMPPSFQREGIDAAKEMRKRHPGHRRRRALPVRRPRVRDLAAGRGRGRLRLPAEGPHRRGQPAGRRVRAVATGGSVLDPTIVEALVHPVAGPGGLTPAEEELLRMIAEGKPIKAIAAAQQDAAGGGGRRGREAVRASSPRACRAGTAARCAGCACCTRPSSTARSRARR